MDKSSRRYYPEIQRTTLAQMKQPPKSRDGCCGGSIPRSPVSTAAGGAATSASTRRCPLVKLQGGFGDSIEAALAKRGFKLGKTIGKGSYCQVRQASTLSDGRPLACKIINKSTATKEFVNKFLPRELSIVADIRHKHIVTVHYIIEIGDQVYMFMDLCSDGDLLDYIRDTGPMSETRGKYFFRQLVDAVSYLHDRDIAHRDLKCENVLLASKDCLRITDFGFSRRCRDATGQRILSDTFCGSAAYAAPEILQGLNYNPKMYDVWSLGCILYIMLYATMPFDDKDQNKMVQHQNLRKIKFPTTCKSNLSIRAVRLIKHILEPDITRRATIKQIASSVWLQPTPLPSLKSTNENIKQKANRKY